jgi:phosphoenolpyruvate synthase/pyruvate phosphate dikinase
LSQTPKEKLFVLSFTEIGKEDTALVGGKCANLGEMITKAAVPAGLAVTAY